MRSRVASVLAACLPLLGSLTTNGQEALLENRYLLLRSQGVRPEVMGNRLAVICRPSAHSRNFSTPSEGGDALETLAIQLEDGHLRLRYESLVDGRLVLEVTDRRQVRLQREGDGKRILYEQGEEGGVRLDVTVAGKTVSRTASGLWQMLIFDSLAQTELLPLLEQLRPGWRLAEQARAAEHALVSAAESNALADRARWDGWLQQLASPDFRVRVSAERKLRAAGASALGWLERQEISALDPEQRDHILTLRADLTPTRADFPDLVAAWLVDDKRVWLAMLDRDEIATRTLAQRQLEALCRRTIPFDPQAEAAVRRQQLTRLGARLGQ